MKRGILLLSLVLCACSPAEIFPEINNHQPALEQLVDLVGLQYEVPEGFEMSPGAANDCLDYEFALRSLSPAIEVRFSLRPLQGIAVEYEDPHSSTPNPEHIYPLMYQSIIQKISLDPYAPSGGMGDNALAEHNADWGEISLLQPKPENNSDLKSLVFMALHRQAVGDIYVSVFFDDYESSKSTINQLLKTVKFAQKNK
ncbi:MAG: hypothetical protein H8E25_08700 [Planctomycetes bacterium]|nr:hypothetical protein [Planctomycetota bacterium]